MTWTYVGHNSDTAKTRPSTFFLNYLMDQKRIQRFKNSSLFEIFFLDINRNNTSYFFERGIGSIHDIH